MRLRGITCAHCSRFKRSRRSRKGEALCDGVFDDDSVNTAEVSTKKECEQHTLMSELFWSPFSGTISLSAFSSLI